MTIAAEARPGELDDGAPLHDPALEAATHARQPRGIRSAISHLSVLGWVALGESAFLASTVLWQPRPLGLALALGLLGGLCLAGWRAQGALRSVRAAWTLPSPPHAGDETTVISSLSAVGGAPPLQVRALSVVTKRLEIVARLPGLDAMPTRAQWTTRFPRRGLVSLPRVTVSTDQPFGLVVASRAVGDVADLLVLPAIGRLRRDLRARIDQWLEAQAATTDPGDDEIARLRPYRPGDHPHRIHWKASARHRGLLVAERHAPGTRRLALVVDTASAGDSRRLERIICVAATLTDYLIGLGWSVTLHAGFAPHGCGGDRARLFEALALAGSSTEAVTAFIPPHRTALILSINPLPPLDLRPAPLNLTLSECERLVRLPRRLR
jgi:uncharacterized protein (DUF58 family)